MASLLTFSKTFQCARKFSSYLPKFEIRRLTSGDEVLDIVAARVAAWGRKPGALDHLIYFSIDKTGFFAGELDGQTIGCISAVKFSEDSGVLAYLVVDKPYCGNGYGIALMEAALASLPQKCNVSFEVHAHKIAVLENRYGFKRGWKFKRVSVVMASKASAALSKCSISPTVRICNLHDIPFANIVEYDSAIITNATELSSLRSGRLPLTITLLWQHVVTVDQ